MVRKGVKLMNHVQESRTAWENAVKAAKAGQHPIQIWPGDEDRITIDDLPTLPDGWVSMLHGRAWDFFEITLNDLALQRKVLIGRKYAIVNKNSSFATVLELP